MLGGTYYTSRVGREQQSGAVMERTFSVQSGYEAHARMLDRDYGTGGTVLARLRTFTPVRALVFGAYGEMSDDVHALLDQASRAMARKRWRALGARSEAECRSYFIGRLRQRMCLAVTRAYARFRIRRLYYVGLPREALGMMRARGDAGAGVRRDDMDRLRLEDFYGYQLYQGRYGLGGGAALPA